MKEQNFLWANTEPPNYIMPTSMAVTTYRILSHSTGTTTSRNRRARDTNARHKAVVTGAASWRSRRCHTIVFRPDTIRLQSRNGSCQRLTAKDTPTLNVLSHGTRQNAERDDLRAASPLVSFYQVIDPHFVTISSSLYTTIRNPKRHPIPLTVTLQWSLIRRQALEICKLSPFRSAPQIRPAPRFVACRYRTGQQH